MLRCGSDMGGGGRRTEKPGGFIFNERGLFTLPNGAPAQQHFKPVSSTRMLTPPLVQHVAPLGAGDVTGHFAHGQWLPHLPASPAFPHCWLPYPGDTRTLLLAGSVLNQPSCSKTADGKTRKESRSCKHVHKSLWMVTQGTVLLAQLHHQPQYLMKLKFMH